MAAVGLGMQDETVKTYFTTPVIRKYRDQHRAERVEGLSVRRS